MINNILCFLIGHRLQLKGEFKVVEFGRVFTRPYHHANVFRCYRCGCEVKRSIKR